MMKEITTKHPEVGYSNNVSIIERALREYFGIDDSSYAIVAVAAHIWGSICAQVSEEKKWGLPEIVFAISTNQHRLRKMMSSLPLCALPGCAISYPHFSH